ncbi:DMT family transporter [Nocardia blacklockiae]|uniref:DMT family transporter n=1 Tax=Nocardia blacklockiae TaxID=480036 RepID=UPI002B4B4816|nr:DMT family transporter [Nocardia blacklockiae]
MTQVADSLSEPASRRGRPDLGSAGAALVAVVLWASAFVAIRDAGPHLSPAPMALLRLAVAAVALTIPVLARRGVARRVPRSPRALLLVAAYAVLWLAGYTVALNTAELHVDAGTAALLVNLAPLLVAFGAAVLFRERLTRSLLIGAVLSLAGVAIIAVSSGAGHRDGLGVLLCVVAAVLYAAGVLVQKPALRYVDALTAIWLGCLIGTVALLPWAGQLVAELSAAPGRVVADGVYLGLLPTALGFTAWSYALHRTDAGRLTASTYAVPAISILLSWALLGEIPTAWGLLGGTVCLVGVALSRRTGGRTARPRARSH